MCSLLSNNKLMRTNVSQGIFITKEKYSCVVLKLDLNQTVLKIKERRIPSGLGVKAF